MKMTSNFWLIAASLGLVSARLVDPTQPELQTEQKGLNDTCGFGFGSANCSTPVCNAATTCSNQGECNADKTCTCGFGFRGDDCSIPVCDADTTCNQQGECNADGTCSCKTDFMGDDCSIPDGKFEDKTKHGFAVCNVDGVNGLTWIEVSQCIEKYHDKIGLLIPTMTKKDFFRYDVDNDEILTWTEYEWKDWNWRKGVVTMENGEMIAVCLDF